MESSPSGLFGCCSVLGTEELKGGGALHSERARSSISSFHYCNSRVARSSLCTTHKMDNVYCYVINC